MLSESAGNQSIIELLKNVEETPEENRQPDKTHEKLISFKYDKDVDIAESERETSKHEPQKMTHHRNTGKQRQNNTRV